MVINYFSTVVGSPFSLCAVIVVVVVAGGKT